MSRVLAARRAAVAVFATLALPSVWALGAAAFAGTAPAIIPITWQPPAGVVGGGFDHSSYQGTAGQSVVITNQSSAPVTVTFTNLSDKAAKPTSVVVAPKGAKTGNPKTAPALAGTFGVHGNDGQQHLTGTVDAQLQVKPAPPARPNASTSPSPRGGSAGSSPPPASRSRPAGQPAPSASGRAAAASRGNGPGALSAGSPPALVTPPGGVLAVAPDTFAFNATIPTVAPNEAAPGASAGPSVAPAPTTPSETTPSEPSALTPLTSGGLPPTSTLRQGTGLAGMSVPGRSLGLPATIAAIAVVGLCFALGRVLLGRPAPAGERPALAVQVRRG